MNRGEFLKRLGIGTAAIIVAPSILAEKPKEKISVFMGDEKIAEAESHEIEVDLPESIGGNFAGYAVLLKDNKPVAYLHDFCLRIERRHNHSTDEAEWLYPYPIGNETIFTGTTTSEFLRKGYFDVLELRYFLSKDVIFIGNVVITAMSMDDSHNINLNGFIYHNSNS